jgi:hypothetical protein
VIDITALAAEVGLHVDDDEGGIVGSQGAVIGPGIGIGLDIVLFGLVIMSIVRLLYSPASL